MMPWHEKRYSLRWAAHRLGFRIERLRAVAIDVTAHYRTFVISESRKKGRTIDAPSALLKSIQHRICAEFLIPAPLHSAAHGSVRGCSPVTNAEHHLHRKLLVKIDITDFFHHVSHRTVYSIYKHDLGLGPDLARLLTILTTIRGGLPQGAPTSSALANLALKPIDSQLERLASDLGVHYTRYVDDLVFSGSNARKAIEPTIRLLRQAGFRINRSKLSIESHSEPQTVTGLGVNARRRMSVSKGKRNELRELIRRASPRLTPQERASILSRLAYLGRFHPGEARRLSRRFLFTISLPDSQGDVATDKLGG